MLNVVEFFVLYKQVLPPIKQFTSRVEGHVKGLSLGD